MQEMIAYFCEKCGYAVIDIQKGNYVMCKKCGEIYSVTVKESLVYVGMCE